MNKLFGIFIIASLALLSCNNQTTSDKSETSGVIFSDGIESDFLNFNSGSIATIGIAKEKARLVTVK